MYEPDVESLKGNKVRSRLESIEDVNRVDIPNTIRDLHAIINLSVDYFVVQGILFLHSVSQDYDSRTVECIKYFEKKYNNYKILRASNSADMYMEVL